MRRFMCIVSLVFVSSYGLVTLAATSSFPDAANHVQTGQQSCQKSDNPTDCIKKLSSDYSALYQAVLPLASQTIDSGNPLAGLAQKQVKQYQDIKTYIEQNALGLMNGTTTVPDSLLTGAAAGAASPAVVTAVPTAVKCPNESIVTSLPAVTLDAVEPTATAATASTVSGKVPGVTTGKVQVCVAGKPLRDPVAVSADGTFKATVPSGTTLTNGQAIVAQYIKPGSNGGPDTYGPTPDANSILVGSCKMDAAKTGIVPVLNVSPPNEQGMVTYSGTANTDNSGKPATAASGANVRICVNDIPNEVAKTAAVGADGTFDGKPNPFKVQPGDQITAQLAVPGTPPASGGPTPYTYGPLSSVVPVSSTLVVGTPPSKSNGMVATIVAGVEQSGYSSLGNNTGAFLNAFIRSSYIPLSQKLGLAAWGRVRLLSAPQPGTVGIASILTDPTGTITTQNWSSIGTAIDYVVGPELNLHEWNFDKAITRVSLIAGVGATTPLSSNSVTVSYSVPPPNTAECEQLLATYGAGSKFGPYPYLFKNPSQLSCIWNPANGTAYNFISFANENRSNFLMKWGIGGRFTHVFPAKDKTPSYAGSLDVLVGQDSSVTGGKVSGWAFKLDGVYPVPFTGSLLYVFGSATMRFTHNQEYPPLILANATNAPAPPSTQVAVLSLTQPNRDFYRLGFGLNLATIWCKFSSAGCPTQQAAADKTNSADKSSNTTAPAAKPATPPNAGSKK